MSSKATDKEKSVKKEKNTIKKSGKYFYANGKRKTSVSLVRLYKGNGNIVINNKPINEYCSVKTHIGIIKSPLKLTGSTQKFDISVIVKGGGPSSQADAIRHGIAKALVESDPLNRPTLKKAGMLTRDSRTKERKKFGLKKARKAPQFSKR